MRSLTISILLVLLVLNIVIVSSLKLNNISSSWKRSIASLSIGLSVITSGNILHANADMKPAPWDDKVQYELLKSNPSAPQPKVGEMVAIRFKGSYKGVEFDNTFQTSDPYFYRAGVGLIIKGLDDAIPTMHVGDRVSLKFSGDRSFEKGKASSPGKPRIPPGAEVEYEVELTELPSAAEEFILDIE